MPDGTKYRERVKAPVSTRSAALAWGQRREAEIIAQGGRDAPEKRPLAPTLAEFWPRFMEGYARANQEKPSTLDTREWNWKKHLEPAMGGIRLDALGDEDVQRLKAKMSKLSPKTVNNVLAILSKVLKVAVEWRVIPTMPCQVRLLKASKSIMEFYEDDELQRLVTAAEAHDARTHLAVLLAADAGLRSGEITALEWSDVDAGRGLLKVRRSDYKGQITTPKSGKPRIVPMTGRLRAALKAHRHLRGDRVLCADDGKPIDRWWVKWALDVAERRAGLRRGGRVHILRHTFCSRLAARNVPAITIQHLAGHAGLETTQRYLHLASAAPLAGIRALEEMEVRGDVGETAALAATVSSDIN
jgi:integrase